MLPGKHPLTLEMANKETVISRTAERLLVGFLLAAFLVQGSAALRHMSPTGDETHYLGVGRALIMHQRWDLDDARLHPPLSFYLHSLPLLFLPIDDRLFDIPDMNARGRALMASYSDDRILMLARMPMLLLATALGFLVFHWSRRAYGPGAGLMALFTYVFSPVIISNAAQITPDLCLAAFSTLTFYLLWRYIDSPTPAHLSWIGAALGLTLLSKFSAVLTVIALAAIVMVHFFRRRGKGLPDSQWRISHLVIVFLVALLVVNAGYFFHGSLKMLDNHDFKSGIFHVLARTGIFRILPSPVPEDYIVGMDWQHSVLENGFGSFMLGEETKRGWFHYYLVAFFLKTPVAFLLLILLSARKAPDRLQWMLLAPILIFPAYFGIARLSRGIRYILPIYPLLSVWIGRAATDLKLRGSRVLRVAIPLLLLWYAGSAIRIAPHYLAYINELGGGPDNGANLLYESDFDWGQELKAFGEYLRKNAVKSIKFAYFSTADPSRYGIDFEPLPCDQNTSISGLIAISATTLNWDCYKWLKDYRPINKVGYTIFIYDIPQKP
jgi:4-amino-4-deoxy-L-arabinose transferase-like glycosyltransferase